MSYSMWSAVSDAETNSAFLYLNGSRLDETYHSTFSGNEWVRSTSGRVLTLEASTGDQIEFRATVMDGDFRRLHFCAEFIPKM